jgi:hypothetical protein
LENRKRRFRDKRIRKNGVYTFDVDSTLVNVDIIYNILEIYATFIFRTELCKMGVFPCYSFYLERMTGKVKAGSPSGSVGIVDVERREGVLILAIEFTK